MKVRRHAAGTRAGTGLGRRVRARRAAFDAGVVQLSLSDQEIVPEPGELAGWIDALTAPADGRGRSAPVHTIRTGALFPAAAERFAEAGFEAVDTLTLLEVDLHDPGVGAAVDAAVDADRRARAAARAPLRARHQADAARIDRAAFGDPWGNDARDLTEIRRATPVHHAAGAFAGASWTGRRLLGFAITGAAAERGYLQRLAVDPGHQRRGYGRLLTVDALVWMRRRRLSAGLVNTGTANEAALALYRSLGFRPRPERLHVMQLAVTTGP